LYCRSISRAHLDSFLAAPDTNTLGAALGTTLTWTLILNLYVPQYDTILVITSIIITARALKKFNSRVFVAIIVGLVISSYVTQVLAEATGVQALSILLIALGAMQMRLCFSNISNGARLIELVDKPFSISRSSTVHVPLAGAAAGHG